MRLCELMLCLQIELQFLSILKHPNVVKLMGYCSEGKHRILVREYMTKGSLEDHLLRSKHQELITNAGFIVQRNTKKKKGTNRNHSEELLFDISSSGHRAKPE